MEIKLLLLKTIGAIYYSSHAGKSSGSTLTELIDRVLEHINLSEDPTEAGRERSTLLKIRSILIWMKSKGDIQPYDLNDLMTRLRVATGDNDRLYDLFQKGLLLVDDAEIAANKTAELAGELYEFLAIEEFTALLRKSSRQLGFDRESIDDIRNYRDELLRKLQELPLGGKRHAAQIARCVDISDIGSVKEVYHMAQTAINPKAILKFAHKAKNRMSGEQYGARRGEWSNVSALAGNNKSGNLLDDLIAFCCYNDPVLFDETKKPLHVYTTIEDKLELVFQKLYVILKQEESGLPVKILGIDPHEMADYVYKRLTARGWNVRFVEFPNGGSWKDYVSILKGFQEEGFEIVTAGCDYVNLLGKDGIPVQTAGDEVQGAHRYVRAFTAPNDIYHYTAHQLSTDARTLSRQYPDDYIKRLPGKGFYEGSKKLDTEFDYSYIVAKTVAGGSTWQEFQWEKHRKLGATAEADKYFVLKFQELPMIGFKHDIEMDQDLSYKKVGGRTGTGAGSADRDWDSFGD